MPELSSGLIQKIAQAAATYALMKARRVAEWKSYRDLPRAALEAVAREEQLPFDAAMSDFALVQVILDKKAPVEAARQ